MGILVRYTPCDHYASKKFGSLILYSSWSFCLQKHCTSREKSLFLHKPKNMKAKLKEFRNSFAAINAVQDHCFIRTYQFSNQYRHQGLLICASLKINILDTDDVIAFRYFARVVARLPRNVFPVAIIKGYTKRRDYATLIMLRFINQPSPLVNLWISTSQFFYLCVSQIVFAKM